MVWESLNGIERQALAILSEYIYENHYGTQWSVAIDFSGVDFDWHRNERLIKAQSFDDPDYPTAIKNALTSIYLQDKAALGNVLSFIFNRNIPENNNVKQAIRNLELIQGGSNNIVISINGSSTREYERVMSVNPIFIGRDFPVDDALVFMLMPFRDQFNRIFVEHIKPKIEQLGLRIMKSNDIFSTHPIMEDVWEYLCKSRIVIADVTNRNPNVFYELGIAHTLGKEVIIITQNEADIPFDLRHLRYFKYSDDQPGWQLLKENLEKVITTILRH